MSPPTSITPLIKVEGRPRRTSIGSDKGDTPLRVRRSSITSNSSTPTVTKTGGTGPSRNPLYKTSMCANYMSTGTCPYHGRCQFARAFRGVGFLGTDAHADGQDELELWQAKRNERLRLEQMGVSHDATPVKDAKTEAPHNNFSLFVDEGRRASMPPPSSTRLLSPDDRDRAATAPDRVRSETVDNNVISQLYVPSLINLDMVLRKDACDPLSADMARLDLLDPTIPRLA